MKKNVGRTDKLIRLLIAIICIWLYISHKVNGNIAIVVLIVGLLMLFTAMVQFCPLYALLKLSTNKPEANFKQLLSENAIIIDVRQPQEYNAGHIPNSKNIPLNELPKQLQQLKGHTVITCCASGARSAMAKKILESNGITAFNGGGWTQLQQELN